MSKSASEEATVIATHGLHPSAMKVRLWSGEELWVNRHVVDYERPLQIGDVIEVHIEYQPVVRRGRRIRKAAS